MKLKFSWYIFEKYSNINLHENPPSGSRVVPRGRSDGRTDMMKVIVAVCNFVNAPKKKASWAPQPVWKLWREKYFVLVGNRTTMSPSSGPKPSHHTKQAIHGPEKPLSHILINNLIEILRVVWETKHTDAHINIPQWTQILRKQDAKTGTLDAWSLDPLHMTQESFLDLKKFLFKRILILVTSRIRHNLVLTDSSCPDDRCDSHSTMQTMDTWHVRVETNLSKVFVTVRREIPQ